jgi:CRP/FNR family transcriptional regulator, cyclic AMP receptor protein
MTFDPAFVFGLITTGCRGASTGVDLAIAFAVTGAALSVASALMKRMVPLRTIALAANASFFIFGLLERNVVMMLLHGSMLPVNAWRALNIRKLVRDIEAARSDMPVADWLLPHMKRRLAKAGQTLWRRGDTATEMLYLQSGTLRLVEYGEILGPGSLVGEIGLFAPDNRRTQSLECASDCVLYSLTAPALYQLYYQNPKLGFHIMRLVVGRLIRDAAQARSTAGPAAGPAEPQQPSPVAV